MATRLEVYKCDKCGILTEILNTGEGSLTCCGQAMMLQAEGTVDAAREKHVPAITKTPTGFRVEVGAVAHPMLPAHYIQWVELLADGVSYTKFLSPGDAPVAEFSIDADKVVAREYCNLHGHWKAEA